MIETWQKETCESKLSFPSKAAVTRFRHQSRYRRCRPYRCEVCGQWHLSKMRLSDRKLR